MAQHAPFSGVLSPVLTPFDRNLNPDTDRFVDFCKRLLAEGCNGLAVFGTTSESNSLGVDEKQALLEALVAGGVDPAALMPGTGLSALTETVRLTKAAVHAGCGGVLLLPPFYYKAINDEGLFTYTSEVIQRVGDSRLKIYLYHIPPVAVVGWSLPLIERLMKTYPETIVGLKDSSGDWNNTKAVLDAFPGFGVFCGSEIFLLDTLRNGGAGSITATANINARAIRHLYDHWQDSNADALQAGVTAFRKALQQKPAIPAMKALLAHAEGQESWRAVRPPLQALNAEEGRQLAEALKPFGLAAAAE
ncbi:dihydrodipicolinate synthase family protein [Limibacillus halophilus]|uniref:4-hydroxy-tetrahydrodipicolinate synthase n=1 Tax=Limibacillus halophilus TaxID=1579333 RepID=A0A839SUE8_9PROT|nr:dihydrodipicolinate synthase family protein [Limibacillus halophilus]MBB3065320.1 4-hydroxy-tetrahydrodipicolinate synthase [Limibacillus halophilus]